MLCEHDRLVALLSKFVEDLQRGVDAIAFKTFEKFINDQRSLYAGRGQRFNRRQHQRQFYLRPHRGGQC